MRTSLDLHAIAFPRAGDVLVVPRIRRGGANFIFLLIHSISLPPLPLMASVSLFASTTEMEATFRARA